MTTKELRNNIEKVLGNSIRCLLPSYWWKRLFHQVADTIDEVADTIDEVADTIGDINDITIVDSESKLSRLDVPNGSVASVYNERKFKFSECYSITPEDSNLSNDEIFAKCTRIKAIDVNYDSLSEIYGTNLDAGFFFGYCENNQWERIGALCVEGGMPFFAVVSTNGDTDIMFPLTSNAGQTRCNEYLSQHDMRYIMFQGSTEERLILESIFSVVEANTDVYVKGTSWEKLVKKDEDNMTVEVLDPDIIAGFALIYAFAQMGNSTDLLPVMTKFFTDGVFNLSVWNSLIQELLEFTEDGESMTDEDAEKLNKMTEAIEQMFEYNKSVYQKLKEKCETSESVVLLVDFSNTAKFGWGIEETPTLVGATHCFPAAMDSYLDINGNFSLKITSPCENATLPIELLPDGTMIFGVDGWVDKTTTVIYIPETSDDIEPSIVENNKQAVKDIYNNEEKIQNFTIKYSTGNGWTIGGEASTLLNFTSENVGSVITIRGLFYYKNQLKQLTLSDDTGIPTVVDIEEDITVDTSLSTTSTNPVQNKVVTDALNNKVDKVSGKQLSTEDFTTTLKTKLESLSNYDDTQLESSINTLRSDFDKLVSGDTTTAIKTFNEVIAFLDGISDTQDLEGIIASIQQQIAGKQDTISDLDTIRSGAALGATALQEHQQLKTINGQSIIGSGDIEISGGGDTSNFATKEELAECEEVTAAALNELNGRVNELDENVSGTTVTKEEFAEAVDTINTAILENEEITAAALTDLNDRIKALELRIKELENVNQNV